MVDGVCIRATHHSCHRDVAFFFPALVRPGPRAVFILQVCGRRGLDRPSRPPTESKPKQVQNGPDYRQRTCLHIIVPDVAVAAGGAATACAVVAAAAVDVVIGVVVGDMLIVVGVRVVGGVVVAEDLVVVRGGSIRWRGFETVHGDVFATHHNPYPCEP